MTLHNVTNGRTWKSIPVAGPPVLEPETHYVGNTGKPWHKRVGFSLLIASLVEFVIAYFYSASVDKIVFGSSYKETSTSFEVVYHSDIAPYVLSFILLIFTLANLCVGTYFVFLGTGASKDKAESGAFNFGFFFGFIIILGIFLGAMFPQVHASNIQNNAHFLSWVHSSISVPLKTSDAKLETVLHSKDVNSIKVEAKDGRKWILSYSDDNKYKLDELAVSK